MESGATDRGRTIVLLSGTILVAVVFRLVGLMYGLPAVYNPDEIAIMNRALTFATGSLNPHNFVYPTLYSTCCLSGRVLRSWPGM